MTDLGKQYRHILDRSFAAQFPGWTEMSPLDPVKLLAESLAGSLAAVEARQRRVLDSALDCLPSLFSVRPRPGRLPVGLFRVRSLARLREPVALDEAAALRFQTPTDTVTVTPAAPVRVAPISEFHEDDTGATSRVLTLRHRGPAAELVFQFLPAAGPTAAVLLDVMVSVRDEADQVVHLSRAGLSLVDETEGFTQFGELRLQRADRAPLVAGTGDPRVEVTLRFDVPPRGRFHVNVFPFRIGRRGEGAALGALQGEAWEEVPLPDDLPEAPATIVVHYPDGRQRRLERLADDALLARTASPERFENGFLPHGARHAVILPAGDLLLGHYNGGVTLGAVGITRLPGFDWLPDGYQPVLGELASSLEEVVALEPLLPSVPRESGAAYLARFYAMLRAFHAHRGRGAGLHPRELELELLGAEPSLRAVEVAVDAATKLATIHCLATRPGPHAFRLDADVSSRLRALAAQAVPLPFGTRLSPFRPRPLELAVSLSLEAREERLSALTPEAIEQAVGTELEKLLWPPPFGDLPPAIALERAELATLLKDRLGRGPLLAREEITACDLTLRDDAGSFLSTIIREPGDCWMPRTRARALVRVKAAERGAVYA